MADRFTVTRYHYERDYDDEDDELVDEEEFTTDLMGALDELAADCWDYEDWRGDEVILYPADHHMDPRTGRISVTHHVIKAAPRHFYRFERYVMRHAGRAA